MAIYGERGRREEEEGVLYPSLYIREDSGEREWLMPRGKQKEKEGKVVLSRVYYGI